jgi:hypothetical protein
LAACPKYGLADNRGIEEAGSGDELWASGNSAYGNEEQQGDGEHGWAMTRGRADSFETNWRGSSDEHEIPQLC